MRVAELCFSGARLLLPKGDLETKLIYDKINSFVSDINRFMIIWQNFQDLQIFQLIFHQWTSDLINLGSIKLRDKLFCNYKFSMTVRKLLSISPWDQGSLSPSNKLSTHLLRIRLSYVGNSNYWSWKTIH